MPDRELTYRRPLNVGSLGTLVTPRTRLLYASGALSWVAGIPIFFYLEVGVFTPWSTFGLLILLFYGYKYFVAYRHWLDSYTKSSQLITYRAFCEVLTRQQQFKNSPMIRDVIGRWLKFSQPRQERWNRTGDSLRVSKLRGKSGKELRQDHRPSLFTFPIDVTNHGGTQVEPSRTPHLLGNVGSHLILSLHDPMANTPH